MQSDGYNVSIDGISAAFVPAAAVYPTYIANALGPSSMVPRASGRGRIKFPMVDNVVVTDQDGSSLYENEMTIDDTLDVFSVAPLDTSVCLDGAKRDRLVWIGDFYYTARIISASTARFDYIMGTMEFEFPRQKPEAPVKHLVPISPRLGSTPEYELARDASYLGLVDYQYLLPMALAIVMSCSCMSKRQRV